MADGCGRGTKWPTIVKGKENGRRLLGTKWPSMVGEGKMADDGGAQNGRQFWGREKMAVSLGRKMADTCKTQNGRQSWEKHKMADGVNMEWFMGDKMADSGLDVVT